MALIRSISIRLHYNMRSDRCLFFSLLFAHRFFCWCLQLLFVVYLFTGCGAWNSAGPMTKPCERPRQGRPDLSPPPSLFLAPSVELWEKKNKTTIEALMQSTMPSRDNKKKIPVNKTTSVLWCHSTLRPEHPIAFCCCVFLLVCKKHKDEDENGQGHEGKKKVSDASVYFSKPFLC